jgi:hypothetical protein
MTLTNWLLVLLLICSIISNLDHFKYWKEKIWYNIVAWRKPFKVGDYLYDSFYLEYAKIGDGETAIPEYSKIIEVSKTHYHFETVTNKNYNSATKGQRLYGSNSSRCRKYRAHRDMKLSSQSVNLDQIKDFINS